MDNDAEEVEEQAGGALTVHVNTHEKNLAYCSSFLLLNGKLRLCFCPVYDKI